MVVSQTLHDRIVILSRDSREMLAAAGAYTIIYIPKLMMIGGGGLAGYGLATGNYSGAVGGGSV